MRETVKLVRGSAKKVAGYVGWNSFIRIYSVGGGWQPSHFILTFYEISGLLSLQCSWLKLLFGMFTILRWTLEYVSSSIHA